MMYRPNGARTTRHYVQVCLLHGEIEQGWAAFRHVPQGNFWRLRSTVTPVGVTAVFERI